jgi:sec-independent protein translocase protein TatB
MLFDLGWSELLLIGVVALVVVGPKDLPKALRVAGYWVRKAREMSREFQTHVDQMIREAELEEVHQEITKVGEFDLEHEIRRSVDSDGSLAEALEPPELPGLSDPASAEESSIEPELPLPAPAAEEEHADEPELPLAFPVPAAEPAEAPSAAEPPTAAPEPAEAPSAAEPATAAPEPGVVPPRP